MFTIDELLSNRNLREAFAHFRNKNNGKGADNVPLSELQEYWDVNHETIINQLREGTYEPGIVKEREIINGKGKRRNISVLTTIDRFITRLLQQKMKRYIEEGFLPCSFAFQENKGIQSAVNQSRIYLNGGCDYVVSIDIKDYFDTIDHKRMMELVRGKISDEKIQKLIESYIKCNVQNDDRIEKKTRGLVQGNSISPILSNLYLHELDEMMENKGYCWVRFADDINIYATCMEEASEILEAVSRKIRSLGLELNERKTGVFNPFEEIFLGYDFYKGKDGVEVKKHIYQKISRYKNWHDSAIEKVNHEYHLVKNGVLNKKDFSLLFESEKEKYHIPIEVADQLNVYSEITVTSESLKFLSDQGIRIAFLTKYGQPMGYYIPQNNIKSGQTLINQFRMYLNDPERLRIAKKLEMAGFHNMRSNLRYYNKREKGIYDDEIKKISEYIKEVNEAKSIDQLMLIEGRCRQNYYLSFNKIIKQKGFEFKNRTKQPPEDPLNALISFLNTLLYNEFTFHIYKTTLDIRVGVIHATTKRNLTLNLDFADLFKPIIVDRIIFTIINTNQIKADKHFEERNKGIYLNEEGKRIVVRQFEEKINDKLVMKDKAFTYRQILEKEVWKFLRYINEKEEYKPYKYY